LLNRSDHAGVLRNEEELLIFGGLYTDVSDDTIYIMKDFLRIDVPEIPAHTTSRAPLVGSASRLEWGPAWRFDHSMVLAPRLVLKKHEHELSNVPVLFGGGSGMDIFGDVWTYDVDLGQWLDVVPTESSSAAATFITSLLFGTVGFVLYTCVIICVFMRKIARSRRESQTAHFGDAEAAQVNGPHGSGHRSGISQDIIDALPRIAWAETTQCQRAKKDVAEGSAPPLASNKVAPSGAKTGGSLRVEEACERCGPDAADVAGGETGVVALCDEAATCRGPCSKRSDVDEDEGGTEREICSVCLSQYDAADLLIRLPCAHLFHEACISRWLQQDGSCPQCRFNLRGTAMTVVAGRQPLAVEMPQQRSP